MNIENIDDIDYENMDDLPLSAHIEWNHYMAEDIAKDDDYEAEWLFA